jgi:hypothetical protein
MSDWQKELAEVWETIISGVEEMGNGVREASEEFENLLVDIAEKFVNDLESIANEFKELNDEIWQDIGWDNDSETDGNIGFGGFDTDWSMYYEPHREATAEHQPACVGCRNYNGSMFGGNLLVCGFHPYGWEEGQCPDWEGDEKN